jgi:hypothetical protein
VLPTGMSSRWDSEGFLGKRHASNLSTLRLESVLIF